MNSIEDDLILLSSIRESMADVTDKLKKWDATQTTIEQGAYESMNASDTVLNLSKVGSFLVDKLRECCNELVTNPGEESTKMIKNSLEELATTFTHITLASSIINDKAHTIEKNVADLKEIEEGATTSVHKMSETLDEVIASAELQMVLKDHIF